MKSDTAPIKGKGITQKGQLFMLLGEKASKSCCYRIHCSDKGQFVHEITSDTIQVKCSLQKYNAETLTINHMMENCQVAIILTHKLLFFIIIF